MNQATLLLLGLFLAFIFVIAAGAFFLGTRNTTVPVVVTPTPSPTPLITPPPLTTQLSPAPTLLQTTPAQAVTNFYQAYFDCLRTPPVAAGQVSVYCQSHNPYGALNLPANLNAGGISATGADPVTCSQTPPLSAPVTQVGPVVGNTATVYVTEAFGAGTGVQIRVDLNQEGGIWKVNNIICPRP